MPAIRPAPSSTFTLKSKPTLRQKRRFQRLAAAQLNLRVCTDIDPGVDAVVEGDMQLQQVTLAEELAGGRQSDSWVKEKKGRGRVEPKVAFDEMDVADMDMDVDTDMDMGWTTPTPRPGPGGEKKKFFIEEDSDLDLDLTPTPKIELHLQDKHEIVPGLFVSLSSSIPPTLPASLLREYTHIVRVSHSADRHSWTERDDKHSVDVLNLTIPASSHSKHRNQFSAVPSSGDSGVTSLTIEQLQHARDFLSLSLPYYSLHNPPPTTPLTHPSPAKLLIIAPTHIDALSIVVSYLAFCSGEHAFTVIQYIDEDASVPERWRGVFEVDWTLSFGRERWYAEGAEFVEWAARLDG